MCTCLGTKALKLKSHGFDRMNPRDRKDKAVNKIFK